MKTCKATTRSGEPCRAPAMKGDDYCFHHSPAAAKQRAEARRRGGIVVQHGVATPDRPEVGVRTMGDVLALLEVAAGDLLSQKPSARRARALAYLAGVALKAVEAGSLEERVTALEERLKPRGIA